ncbi:MAG: hypothetical protein E6R03_01325 [Hyphomicrobiaceae bacterium]|nr:MAG: hypothetical protein E6R03_01325 [Hyphomicrobiaceae bacterium]
MTQQIILEEGAFQETQRTQINENFTELYLGFPALSGAAMRVAQVSLTAAELGGVETNTSFTAPTNGIILINAWIKVTDAESGTIDVGTQGTSNDPDGILDGVSVATLGYAGQVPAAKGALLTTFIPGGDPVSVTSSGDLNSCAATLYLQYIELPAA